MIESSQDPIPGTLEPWVTGNAPGEWQLYPFQLEAIQHALDHPRCMLRQDPGGGKTVQGAAILGEAPPGPVLVLVPSTLTLQWADELRRFIVEGNPLELKAVSERRTEPGGLVRTARWTGLTLEEAGVRPGKRMMAVARALEEGPLTVKELVSQQGAGARSAVKRLVEVGVVKLEDVFALQPDQDITEYIEAETQAGRRPIIVVGWGGLVNMEEEISGIPWVQIVIDEVHFGKSWDRERWWREKGVWHCKRKSNRAAVAQTICRRAQERNIGILLLTGTPAPNHRVDWWGQMNFLDEKVWRKTSTWFKKRFCGAEQGEFGMTFKSKTNTEELKSLLGQFVRNTEASVIRAELPGYTIRLAYVAQADQDKVKIDPMYHKLLPKAAKGDRVARGLLREVEASHGARRKRSAGVREVSSTPGRVLLLTTRHADAVELAEAVRKACPGRRVECGVDIVETVNEETGKTETSYKLVDARKRRSMIKRYQKDEDSVLVATGQAWGTGVDGLQCSEKLVLVGLPWTPGELEQWIGRVVRLGQKIPVEIVLLAAESSADDRILPSLIEKARDAKKTAWATLAGDVERAVVEPTDDWKRSLQRRMSEPPNWAS